jgi:pilus assembly protein CpaB
MAAGRGGWRRRGRLIIGAHRRLAAAALAAAAAVLALAGARPAADPRGQAPTRTAVVAAADLGAGETLGAGEVREVALPVGAVPVGTATRRGDVIGRTLAGAVRRGEPLTDARLVGPGLLTAAQVAAGLVAAPVRIADPGTVTLVRAGDHVDVLATTTTGQAGLVTPVAEDVAVLAVPHVSTDPTAAGGDGALIVLAARGSAAVALAGAAVTSRLSITLRAPATEQ